MKAADLLDSGARAALRHPAWLAGLAALVVRLVYVRLIPYESGDWVLYRNVAENIYRGCGVAVTIPGVGDCVPHFGGNQLPLFPAFAAAIWAVSGHSNLAIALAQSALSALSVGYLAYAVQRYLRSAAAALFSGLLLAASPVSALFAGSLLTETLAIAATQWVLAELLLSLAARRTRVVPLAAALIAAVWMRMDGVLLLAPLALEEWVVAEARPWPAIRSWVLIAGLVAATCLGWSVRNVAVGLPPLPRAWVQVDGTYWAPGYTRWVSTWVVGQQERGDALYFDLRNRAHFRLPETAYALSGERAEVARLVTITRATPGHAVPPLADRGFMRLAEQRETAMSISARVELFLARVRAVSARWLWPFARDVGDGRDHVTIADLYRFALVCAAGLAFALGRLRDQRLSLLAALAATYGIVRVAFFAASANTELRYLVELAPFFEVTAGAVAAALLAWVRVRSPRIARPLGSAAA